MWSVHLNEEAVCESKDKDKKSTATSTEAAEVSAKMKTRAKTTLTKEKVHISPFIQLYWNFNFDFLQANLSLKEVKGFKIKKTSMKKNVCADLNEAAVSGKKEKGKQSTAIGTQAAKVSGKMKTRTKTELIKEKVLIPPIILLY